uniref:Uncharacterized protein n=1 Tax=Salix viminalis TaxID=40686 RepID=A0A6N2LIP9_SALVM
MEEDKATTPNKGKDIHVGSASDIEMASNILKKHTAVGQMAWQLNGSESRGSECCIYKVPRSLRNVDSKAYAPQNISIGPLNRKNEKPMNMEKQKYFIKFTERDGMDKKILYDIVISIKNQEECLRHCYSDKSISMNSSDFVEMILLDAVFIIQFFLESNDDTDGPKNFEPRMTLDIREDLMLLENQLPLFIIQEIYDRVNPRGKDAKANPFLDLATCHLRKYLRLQGLETSPGVEGSRHFTDLLRDLMLSGAIKRSYNLDPVKLKYSAVMLHEAGVKFQVTQDKCLVNIKFDKGVLKIPQLEVDHNFEVFAGDVGLLVQKDIILHWLGDDAAVSNMINNFCKNIDDKYTCFGDISKELNAHYENPWNHSKATLKLVYFPNIWRDLLKFTLEFHVNQTLEFNLGLSKNFCINLLEEDPNDISCHCPATDSFDGAAQYALYKRLASALYQSVKFGDLCRTYVKMMFGEDSNLKLKDENWNQLIKEKGLELINMEAKQSKEAVLMVIT